jgi:hypothetical protein
VPSTLLASIFVAATPGSRQPPPCRTPRRLDRRHPEIGPIPDRRLTRPEPDPNLQRLLRASASRSNSCCVSTAHDTAADADERATNNPSSVFLNSRPPKASIASCNSAKYSSRAGPPGHAGAALSRLPQSRHTQWCRFHLVEVPLEPEWRSARAPDQDGSWHVLINDVAGEAMPFGNIR